MSLWDYCGICQGCCLDIKIALTDKDKKLHGEANYLDFSSSKCRNLGENGCKVHSSRPFECRCYPLVPKRGGFTFDYNCPLMKRYLIQLTQIGSEAHKHFLEQKIRWQELSDEEKERILAGTASISAGAFLL